jgi:hypothetical protein
MKKAGVKKFAISPPPRLGPKLHIEGARKNRPIPIEPISHPHSQTY